MKFHLKKPDSEQKLYSAYDPLTSRMITKGLSDATQITALDYLASNLRSNDLLSDMVAVYPFIGGTADLHKWNLLNDSYTLTFYGGLTHSATGILPDGSTGYADTFLNALTSLTLHSNHLSYYSRTNTSVNSFIGISTNSDAIQLLLRGAGTNPVFLNKVHSMNGTIIIGGMGDISASNFNSTGFYLTNRTSSSNHKLYKNSDVLGTDYVVNTMTINPSLSFYLFARNYFSFPEAYDNKECAFASIGYGLSDAKALTLYNIVQQYQTLLSRNV